MPDQAWHVRIRNMSVSSRMIDHLIDYHWEKAGSQLHRLSQAGMLCSMTRYTLFMLFFDSLGSDCLALHPLSICPYMAMACESPYMAMACSFRLQLPGVLSGLRHSKQTSHPLPLAISKHSFKFCQPATQQASEHSILWSVLLWSWVYTVYIC